MADSEQIGGLEALRVLSLESRRAGEMARLIQNYGGVAVSAPAMREVPLEENDAALAFAGQLLAGEFAAVIFLTAVGARLLLESCQVRYGRERLAAAFANVLVMARGPKTCAVLREWGLAVGIAVAEPNTWRDILRALDSQSLSLGGKRVAVQEYGESNPELLEGLRRRGALPVAVPVYQWALPLDLGPLEHAVQEIAAGRIDVLLVTSATQLRHLMQVAGQAGREMEVREGLRRAVVCSIGPVTSEALRSYGLAPDLESTRPRMGQLLFEAAGEARELRRRKLALGRA